MSASDLGEQVESPRRAGKASEERTSPPWTAQPRPRAEKKGGADVLLLTREVGELLLTKKNVVPLCLDDVPDCYGSPSGAGLDTLSPWAAPRKRHSIDLEEFSPASSPTASSLDPSPVSSPGLCPAEYESFSGTPVMLLRARTRANPAAVEAEKTGRQKVDQVGRRSTRSATFTNGSTQSTEPKFTVADPRRGSRQIQTLGKDVAESGLAQPLLAKAGHRVAEESRSTSTQPLRNSSALCRSRRELSNAYFELFSCKIWRRYRRERAL